MIFVVNKRTSPASPNDVYIGRGSPLGNPFSHKEGTKAEHVVESRDKAVELYEEWIRQKIVEKDPAICNELNRIWKRAQTSDVSLVCFCAPLKCHGEVIRKIILEH